MEIWYDKSATDQEIKECHGDYIGCEICVNAGRCFSLLLEKLNKVSEGMRKEDEGSREEILKKLKEADIVIELTGEQAKSMKHGMCAYNKNAKKQSEILFIETDEEKLTAFEQAHPTEKGGEG